MTGRRKQAGDRSRQTCEEKGETPSRSRAKRLTRGARAVRSSPSSAVSGHEEASNPDKKTPKRLSRCRSWTSAISSPCNDAEPQHEIFWDANSPTSFKIEHGKKRQTSKCTVEISDIVNRIAPKNEKPTSSDAAYLGVWIGEDAIPCTPVVTRTRTKMNRCRIIKTEEELMELAKQLDRNLVEQKDQHDDVLVESKHGTVNVGTVQENDLLLGDIPEEDDGCTALKSVSQSSGVAAALLHDSQRSVDQEAEEALNALFDCSTQKYSGQLSQGLSDVSKSSHQDVPCDTKNITDKNQYIFKEKIELQKSKGSDQCTLTTKVHSGFFQGENETVKQAVYSQKESAQSSEVTQPLSSSQDDFEDEWGEDLLQDDSFVMQITQNPELIATPKSNLLQEKPQHANLDTVGGNNSDKYAAKSFQKRNSSTFVSGIFSRSEESKLKSSVTNKPETSLGKNVEVCARGGNVAKTFCGAGGSCWPSEGQIMKQTNTDLKSTTNSSYNDSTSKTFTFLSSKPSSSKERKDLVQKSAQTLEQSHNVLKSKDATHVDEWDDPKFSDEVLNMFCESSSLWEDEEEDDDLLYQVCNDVERLSQIQISEENSQFGSSDRASTQTVTNHNGNHAITSLSSKFGLNCNREISKSVSAASGGGNCTNLLQNSSLQRSNQMSLMPSKSNYVPIGVECKNTQLAETRLQNRNNPLARTTTTTNPHAPSKYTFTKIKPSQTLSAQTNNSLPGNESISKGLHLQSFSESNKRNTRTQVDMNTNQQPLLKRHSSESAVHPSKVFIPESKNKCSMEEIERKKQEALARRQMRARACSSGNAPT